jgi:hypothetical protein
MTNFENVYFGKIMTKEKYNMYNLKRTNILSVLCSLLFLAVLSAGALFYPPAPAKAAAPADLSIPVRDVSATAKFYPVEIDGVKMEVIAVKAPDGSIRTAFNTVRFVLIPGAAITNKTATRWSARIAAAASP